MYRKSLALAALDVMVIGDLTGDTGNNADNSIEVPVDEQSKGEEGSGDGMDAEENVDDEEEAGIVPVPV
jgi:hypothetical protein